MPLWQETPAERAYFEREKAVRDFEKNGEVITEANEELWENQRQYDDEQEERRLANDIANLHEPEDLLGKHGSLFKKPDPKDIQDISIERGRRERAELENQQLRAFVQQYSQQPQQAQQQPQAEQPITDTGYPRGYVPPYNEDPIAHLKAVQDNNQDSAVRFYNSEVAKQQLAYASQVVRQSEGVAATKYTDYRTVSDGYREALNSAAVAQYGEQGPQVLQHTLRQQTIDCIQRGIDPAEAWYNAAKQHQRARLASGADTALVELAKASDHTFDKYFESVMKPASGQRHRGKRR